MKKNIILIAMLLVTTACSNQKNINNTYNCGNVVSYDNDKTTSFGTAMTIKNNTLKSKERIFFEEEKEEIISESTFDLELSSDNIYNLVDKENARDPEYKNSKLLYNSEIDSIDLYMYTSTTDEDIIQGSMKPAMRCVPASKNKFDHSKAFEIATEIKEDSTISFEDVYIYTSYALKQRGEEDEPFFIFMPQLNAVAEYDYDEIIVREITNIDDIYYDNWNKNSYSFMFDNDYKTLFYDFGVYDDKVELSDENYGVLNENNNTDK